MILALLYLFLIMAFSIILGQAKYETYIPKQSANKVFREKILEYQVFNFNKQIKNSALDVGLLRKCIEFQPFCTLICYNVGNMYLTLRYQPLKKQLYGNKRNKKSINSH